MSDIVGKPLVTISMMTYNQEKCVRDAVRGLLSQTYEPLEIVISDDCSTDRTWGIITEEVDKYKASGGIHRNIVLNRNEKNMGIAAHASKMFSLTHGIIYICTAGDDISLPTRVQVVVQAWLKSGPNVMRIQHQAVRIDINGREVGLYFGYNKWQPVGAITAYHRKVFEEFPEVKVAFAYEDVVYGYRSLMIGEYLQIPDVLVKYRCGSGVSSQLRNWRKSMAALNCGNCESFKVLYNDMHMMKGKMSKMRFDEIDAKMHFMESYYNNLKSLYGGVTFRERFTAFKSVHVSASPWKVSMFAFFLVQCACLFPCRATDIFIDSVMSIKLKMRMLKWWMKAKLIKNK